MAENWAEFVNIVGKFDHGISILSFPNHSSSGNFNSSMDFENDSHLLNNETGPYHAPQFTSSTFIKVVVLSLITALSLVGNIATLASIIKARRHNTSTVYYLIAHLAVADLMVTLFCVMAEAIWFSTVQWYAGDFTCKVFKFFQMFSLHLSTFILVVIGVDRMCAVRYPMRRMHSKNSVRRGIVCVYVLSAVFSSPQLAIFRVTRGPFVEEFYQCVTYGFYTAAWQEQLYTGLSLVLQFALPLVILITTYTCTFCSISGNQDVFAIHLAHSPIDGIRRKILRKAKMKSLMITVVIVLAFIVCWTPYYVMMIIFIFLDPGEQLSDDLQSAIFFFGSSTAMINPLIYGVFHLRSRGRRGRRPGFPKNSSSSANSTRLDCSSAVNVRSLNRRRTHAVGSPQARESFLFFPTSDSCRVDKGLEPNIKLEELTSNLI